MRIKNSVFFFVASLGSISLPAAEVDTSLIESVVLLNFDALRGESVTISNARTRRAAVDTGLIDANLPNAGVYKNTAALKVTFETLVNGHTDAEIAAAVQYAFNYTLNTGMGSFGLSFEEATAALEVFTEAAFNKSTIPQKLAENLARSALSDILLNWAIKNNVMHVPLVGREIAKAIGKGALMASLADSVHSDVAKTLVSELTAGAIEVLVGSTSDGIGFKRGIIPVSGGTDNTTMQYDGVDKKFHPDKARLIEYVVNGAVFGVTSGLMSRTNAAYIDPEDKNGNGKLDTADNNGDGTIASNENEDKNGNKTLDRSEFLVAISTKAAEAAIAQFALISGDNSLFIYETIKAIGYGTSLGAVLVAGEYFEQSAGENLTLGVAENIAFGIASASMQKVLASTTLSSTADIARLGEAAAYGTAMGTGLAGSMLVKVDRSLLAQVAAMGAAKGALEEAAKVKANTEAGNDELLALARGTAMGSVLGSVAMAVYNHLNTNDVDVQKIVESASLGTAYGSMTANLEPSGDANGSRGKLPGHKEDFEVEIARASANGATTGALFEITSLLKAMPDVRTADIDSIKTAQSASYGVTKGAILGGDDAGLSDVSVKQATEQGATEGSLQGVSLALPDADTIRSESAIKHAIGMGNKDGAIDAARSLALKAINPTVEDMRQLMKLYGINPRLTNPGFIFPNPKRSGEENFLFPPDEIPVASPI
jgi:hypothetical protein